MRRSTILMIVVAAFCAGMFAVSMAVPSFATRALESGRELPLPDQVFIAAGNFWRRYGVFVTILLLLGTGAFSWESRASERPRA